MSRYQQCRPMPTNAKVSFRCTACGALLNTLLHPLGRKIHCPKCNNTSIVAKHPRDSGLAVQTLRAAVMCKEAVAESAKSSGGSTLSAGFLSPMDFQVGKLLGSGRYADVYLGKKKSTGRTVAIKVVPVGDLDPARLRRFCLEAEVLQRLSHPNILHADGCGLLGNRCWMVMEYMNGGSVADHLREGPIDWTTACGWLRQALCGLGAAHKAGVVHRDIKPENLLLTTQGRLCIADFGMMKVVGCDLKVTRNGSLVGSVAYMAPEQIMKFESNFISDIFSLGVTFYRVLTGRLPFQAESIAETVLLVLHGKPPPIRELAPEIPEAFCRIIERMIEKKPVKRYRNTREILADIKVLLTP